jgi:hypothetical protein
MIPSIHPSTVRKAELIFKNEYFDVLTFLTSRFLTFSTPYLGPLETQAGNTVSVNDQSWNHDIGHHTLKRRVSDKLSSLIGLDFRRVNYSPFTTFDH